MRIMVLAAAAAALSATYPAAALDMPSRRPGLWEIKMILDGPGLGPQATQQCIDAATDKEMNAFGTSFGHEKCTREEVSRSGATTVVDTECQISGVKTNTRAEITGSFDSAYTVKVTSTIDGAFAPGMPSTMSTSMTIEATWLGACKADQKPGDMILGNDMKVNVRDVHKLGSGMPGLLPLTPSLADQP